MSEKVCVTKLQLESVAGLLCGLWSSEDSDLEFIQVKDEVITVKYKNTLTKEIYGWVIDSEGNTDIIEVDA